MAASLKQITIGVLALLVLMLAAIVWRWLFPPLPNEQQVIAVYVAHKQDFAALSKMTEKYCDSRPMPPEVRAIANRIDSHMGVYCDSYSNTLRFILGEQGLMTIGPEQAIGLTYFLGDPARHGRLVPVLAPHEQHQDDVYLRRVDDHWYVFSQNMD